MRLSYLFENDVEHAETLKTTGFWGARAAGCILFAEDTKRFLIAMRSAHVEQPRTLGSIGGAIDSDEDPLEAVHREVAEEIGFSGPYAGAKQLFVFRKGTFSYTTFVLAIPHEIPADRFKLNWESDGVVWVTLQQLIELAETPRLHFGLKAVLADPVASHAMLAMSAPEKPVTETLAHSDNRDTPVVQEFYTWLNANPDFMQVRAKLYQQTPDAPLYLRLIQTGANHYRKGLARTIMTKILELADQNRLPVELVATERWEHSRGWLQDWYQRLGFVPTGETTKDGVVMRRDPR